MAIPDYQSIMLPLLSYLGDGHARSIADIRQAMALHFGLSESQQKELLPSGKQSIFANRLSWATTYLKQAGLLLPLQRGRFQITERGETFLRQKPSAINVKTLKQFPEFMAFSKKRQPLPPKGPQSPNLP